VSGKLDLFAVLSYMDDNNLGIYEALREDPDMLKELRKNVIWMLPQWMTGSDNPADHAELVENFNQIGNMGWFDLYDHPELQVKLLACCGLGKKTRHRFFKPTKARQVSKMLDLLSNKYVDINESETVLWCKTNSKAAMGRLAESFGYQPKDVRDLEKSFDSLRKQA